MRILVRDVVCCAGTCQVLHEGWRLAASETHQVCVIGVLLVSCMKVLHMVVFCSHGTGRCSSAAQCNEARGGSCSRNKCKCPKDYTGPHCQTHAGHNDRDWESDYGEDVDWMRHATSLYFPLGLKILVACAAVGLVGVVFYNIRFNRSRYASRAV